MATGMGGMGTGAAIGSMILPGVGTVVGGALGFIGSAMFNQKVNENIDKPIYISEFGGYSYKVDRLGTIFSIGTVESYSINNGN